MHTKRFSVLTALVVCAMVFGGQAALAGTLVDFMPRPASPTLPELVWTGGALTTGTGSVGNGFGVAGPGDGHLPTASQTTPGLELITPFTVAGAPGSEIDITGATTFYNATMVLGGLAAAGPPLSMFGYVVQPLGSGFFELWSTDPDDGDGDAENPVLLLSGTIESAMLGGPLGNSAGGVVSLDLMVTYTGGAIFDAVDQSPMLGQFSWALLDINPVLGTTPNKTLRQFSANAVGQFSFTGEDIPEPASLALLGLGGLAMLRFRR